jgi:hypothetical protein
VVSGVKAPGSTNSPLLGWAAIGTEGAGSVGDMLVAAGVAATSVSLARLQAASASSAAVAMTIAAARGRSVRLMVAARAGPRN